MQRRAEDYKWQDENKINVMAGLFFADVPEGGGAEGACPGMTQPKLYIRMNSSLVHDTTRYRKRWAPIGGGGGGGVRVSWLLCVYVCVHVWCICTY